LPPILTSDRKGIMPPTQPDDRYLAYMGLAPKRIPHWEHWSCPDADAYLAIRTLVAASRVLRS